MAENTDTPQGLSRRSALKAGAVGGAALWTVPLAQVVGTGVAEAVSAPTTPPGGGGGGGGGGGTPVTPTSSKLASFGLVVFRLAGRFYAVQVQQGGDLGGAGNAFLRDLEGSYPGITDGLAEAAGVISSGRTGNTLFASGAAIVAAQTHDGSFGGDKFAPAVLQGGVYYFVV